ncbi:hypothetical protein SDC9_59278 [bioreactor metagenome]|uniref:Uncharacterized protein n=1 Tax=bioreactor metagenome TaxID=1076179 RepID=A0A644XFI2_9ZZZZ
MLRLDNAVRARFNQQFLVQVVLRFGNDFLCAHLTAKHGGENGSANIVSNADDNGVEVAHAELRKRALVGRIRLYGMHNAVLDAVDAVRPLVNNEHLVSERRQHARRARSETTQPDDDKALAHEIHSLSKVKRYPFSHGCSVSQQSD